MAIDIEKIKQNIDPHKQADKQFYLDLLDADKQRSVEEEHISSVLAMMRVLYLNKLRLKIKAKQEEIASLTNSLNYTASDYQRVLVLKAEIQDLTNKMDGYKCFFEEPYFARMDLVDDQEGYNSYYIGKHGDEGLEIVDWRAPLARKYYQKSQIQFAINQYRYKLVLRRSLRTRNGKLLDWQNEFLSVKDVLSKEEIDGRDEEIIFDPFLKDILKQKKESAEITDIIETIQEKQYEIITLPEEDQFIVQGVAGSGKTMILLHRLSYLLYNNERLRPGDILVITPSDSFNAFIEELAEILELEKVKTKTLENYFYTLLDNQGVHIAQKVVSAQLSQEYLHYIYSQKFIDDVDKKLSKIYVGISGLVCSPECEGINQEILANCREQLACYEGIKNAGLRVRRCVLGEIKEKPDGGLYYTKQFRALFNAVEEVKHFISATIEDDRMKGYGYFYRQLWSFYKSLIFIRRYSTKICENAIADLATLHTVVEKEIADLKRYKMVVAGEQVYTYQDRINVRAETIKEIARTQEAVKVILQDFATVCDYADVLRGDKYLVEIGKCENVTDMARFFHREIVNKCKNKYGISARYLYESDAYLLCLILYKLGVNLTPRFGLVFVDEAQDIPEGAYQILRAVNETAKFNIFGDLKQNITNYKGLDTWDIFGFPVYELNQNYRNTNQIVQYVDDNLQIKMQAIGFDGDEVTFVKPRAIASFFGEAKGLNAIITDEASLDSYARKSYNIVRETGRISKTKINLMTVYESKGLEFTSVVVDDHAMTTNEKYIAYTRALKRLAIVR